jgi:8-oxo-dGTP pyrophosphatase MutT (NUDIX family)
MSDISVIPVDRLELAHSSWRWPFASERRGEIDAHFSKVQRQIPALWNGQVLLLRDFHIDDGVFRGACFETDFASFLSWRDWDFPGSGVHNCFGMGVLRGSDGAFVAGVMAPNTANAGKIYFPAGTPDPGDLVGDRLDLTGSVLREVAEETGLTTADFSVDPGWIATLAGPRIAQMKLLRADRPAAALRSRILDHLASEADPELVDVRILRSPADFDPMMPSFMTAFLSYIWGGEAGR